MKITIATGPIFPVPAVRGGAVQRLWEGLAREFAQRGHEVTIFAREFPGQAAEETVDGIRYVRRGGYAQSTSIKRDLVQCLLYALKTARHVPPGDVVVTNDFWMPAVLPWLKPSAGKIVVNANRFPKKQYWLYPKCAAFAAVSAPVAEAIRKQTPLAADRVAVVPNAIDYAFLKETQSRGDRRQGTGAGGPKSDRERDSREEPEAVRPEIAQRQPQDAQEAGGGKPVRILYVGRIHPEKGLGLLAEALRLLAAGDKETGDRGQGAGGGRHTAYGIRHEAEGENMREETGERGQATGSRGQTAEGGRHTAYGIRHEAEGENMREETGDRPSGSESLRVGEGQATGSRRQETEWECVLVGPVTQGEGGGGEAFAEELKRQVEGLPVRFEAPIYDPAALARIYDEADVFVYPSVAATGEAMPLAPVEAMARGVVPVVSDLAVFREYLEPGVNGLVCDHRTPKAAELLAEALLWLASESGRRGEMSARARQTAERFSPAAIADKYLSLFRRCAPQDK